MKVLKRKWELINMNNAQNEGAQENQELISGNNAQNEGGQEKMGVNQCE